MRYAWLVLALFPFASAAGHQASSRTQPPSFPPQLQGTWHPAPHDCGSPGGDGNDMHFEISADQRLNFEDIETAIEVTELPGTPRTWRLTTTSNVVGDDAGQARIYVLGAKYLFVTDGDRMDQYLQCR